MVSRRAEYGRVVLLYGARSPEDMLFAERPGALGGGARHRGRGHRRLRPAGWTGRVGLVTNLVPGAGFDPLHTLALVCGPEVMMRYAATALVDGGVRPERIRLSMERNMKCGIGLCGHCQLRELFLCVDGPVLDYARLSPLMDVREL